MMFNFFFRYIFNQSHAWHIKLTAFWIFILNTEQSGMEWESQCCLVVIHFICFVTNWLKEQGIWQIETNYCQTVIVNRLFSRGSNSVIFLAAEFRVLKVKVKILMTYMQQHCSVVMNDFNKNKMQQNNLPPQVTQLTNFPRKMIRQRERSHLNMWSLSLGPFQQSGPSLSIKWHQVNELVTL